MMKFALSVISVLLITIIVLFGMFLISQSTKENRNEFQGVSKTPAVTSNDKAAEVQ
jgi:hypothetical protein